MFFAFSNVVCDGGVGHICPPFKSGRNLSNIFMAFKKCTNYSDAKQRKDVDVNYLSFILKKNE